MRALAEKWSLDPDFIYLNHGAYGACPREIFRHQEKLRQEMERQPVAFFERRYNDLLDEARRRLADFLGADPQGLVRVTNATAGVNTVLSSLTVRVGDELLVTDHAYNACRNALNELAGASGARVVVAEIPFPLHSAEQVVESVLSRVTARTTFALLDQVTSPTGLVLPVELLTRELEQRGVAVMIDGAHVPGMLPLNLESLGASWYTGNAHKWICAPRAAAFLWARSDRRDALRPLVISHGTNVRRPGRSRFHDEFDWAGTEDPTAFLSVPCAIDTMGAMVEGGWPEIRARNRSLVLAGRQVLLDALEIPAPAPEEMIGALAAVPLASRDSAGGFGADPLQQTLRERYRIEVPIMGPPVAPSRVLRVSAQLYNEIDHYRSLADALRRELG